MPSSKELPPSTTPFFPNQFITNQFYSKAQYVSSDTDLSGKVAIVTGANTGLGLECARQLLSYELSQLIIAVRSLKKGEDVAANLRKKYPKAKIEVWLLDMSSYDSIQAFVSQIEGKLPRLDIAILNAGISKSTFRLANTGHEETMQVNFLSTMLLSILLLPLLKSKSPAGSPGRLTIVTSMLSLTAEFAQKDKIPLLKAFDDETIFDGLDIYPTSKYLGQIFLWKLTDLVSADDVVVNFVEPGFVKGTSLQREAPAVIKFMLYLLKVTTGRSMQLGATTYLDAAITKGKESHGCLLMNWGIAP